MKRFGWIVVLSGVALLVSGCTSGEPQQPAAAPPEDIFIEVEVPETDAPAAPADADQPAEAKPAAKTGKSNVHKAVGSALLKAVTGSGKKPADEAPPFKP